MNTALLYILFSFTGPTWHGSVDVTESKTMARCEAVKAQLETAGSGRTDYKCLTLVSKSAKS